LEVKCTLLQSDSKTNPSKKFKIVVDRQVKKQKILLLECEYKRQRDEWWNALFSTIEACKHSIDKGWSRGESILDFDQNSEKEQEESISTTVMNNETPWNKQDEKLSLEEPSENPEESYDEHYENSFNFALQEFNEIGTMDETASEVSEYDKEFWEKNSQYQQSSMSPFKRTDKKLFGQSDDISPFVNQISVLKDSFGSNGGNHKLDPDVNRSPGKSSIIRRQKRAPSETATLGDKSGVKICRSKGKITEEKERYLERSSNFRIRLNDFEQ